MLHPYNGSHGANSRAPVQAPHQRQARIHGHVTPVVARMAAEHQLDLAQITGTGREGRITKKDVEAYLERQPKQPATATEVAEVAALGDARSAAICSSRRSNTARKPNAVGAQRAAPASSRRARPPGRGDPRSHARRTGQALADAQSHRRAHGTQQAADFAARDDRLRGRSLGGAGAS